MNQLYSLILQEIKQKGPITVQRYMELALYHPLYGYYQSQKVLGKEGDYITAPELTQVFGELLALWMVGLWHRLKKPSPIQIIELGPGRGVMMQDILRIARKFPDFYKGLEVYLVETSPLLKQKQQELLRDMPVQWAEEINKIPEGKVTFFFANEFFDALPIQQEIKVANEWKVRLIGASEEKLCFIDEGEIKENADTYTPYMQEINRRLLKDKGGALIIDYGDNVGEERVGNTLQSLYHHRYADILENPGEQDLTHHVNFAVLKSYLDHEKLNVSLKNQGDFLLSLGLELWIEKLCNKADKEIALRAKAAAARLIAPQEMGNLFKVLAVESQ